MAYPRFRRARAHKSVRCTVSLSITTTTWAALNGSTYDLSLRAQPGDVIEVGVVGEWSQPGAATYVAYLDFATVVSAAFVNHIGSGLAHSDSNGGARSWLARNVSPDDYRLPIGGSVMHTLTSGDIANGSVLLRPIGRLSAAGTRTFDASATSPGQFWAKNLGPATE